MRIKIKNLLRIFLLTVLSFMLFQVKVYSQNNRTKQECPQYIILKKTIIRSSKSGLLSESDWKQDLTWNTCKPQTLGDLPSVCDSYIIPGVSLGDKDNIITTCIYKKVVNSVDPNLNKKKCEVKTPPIISTTSFPNIINMINRLKQEAKYAPMQTDLNIKMQGMIKKITGEECCYSDPYAPPQKYEELSGTVIPAITAKVFVKPFTWKLYAVKWQGIIQYEAEIRYFQSDSYINCSGNASAAGKDYPGGLCKPCISSTLAGNCNVAVYMKGFGRAPFFIPTLGGWKAGGYTEITGYAKLGNSISFSGKVTKCPVEQTRGMFSHTELKGIATAKFTLLGRNIELTQQISLAPAFSKSF